MTKATMLMFLTLISVVDAIAVGAMVGATSRSAPIGILVGLAAAAATWGLVIGIGTAIVRIGTWARLWQRYPGTPGAASGPGSRVICAALGSPWWQINNAIEARADESHLHMRLAIPTVGGDRALSIPWEAVRSIESASFMRAKLDIEGTRIWVPRVVVKDELALRESMAESGEGVEGAPVVEGSA